MVRVQYKFSSSRTGKLKNIKKQRQKYPNIIKDIIKISDLVLEILDARFISETRNQKIEHIIMKRGKKLLYVLNKSDLVDVKAKKKEMEELNLHPYIFVSCKKKDGISKLRNRIKESVKSIDIGKMTRAQVGIIGYPNTGKSTLINVLTGRSSAGTGGEAGFTKGMQKIRLTEGILILDTPGVIPEEEYSHTKKEALQKQIKVGARTTGKIRDPEMFVLELMNTYSAQIEKFYNLEANGDAELFIEKVGRKMHFLKKGNKVDEDRAARLIIRDWQKGRIRI